MIKYSKIFIIVLVIISFIVSWVFIFFLLHMLLEADLSLKPVYRQTTKSLGTSLYLVSYADGPEVFFKNRNILAYSAINRGVDFIYNYRRSHIDPEFIAKNPILNEPVGAGLWKPYLILKTLESIPEGALLLYADSGLLIRQSIREFIDAGFSDPKKSILLFSYDPEIYKLAGSVANGDVFDALGCRHDRCRKGPHVWAGILVVKNTPEGRKFIKDWLDGCCDTDLVMGTNLKSSNYPEFLYHQHDESILSVLGSRETDLVKFIKMDKTFFEYFYMHRRKTAAQDVSLVGFTNMDLTRFERKLLNRPVIKQLRYLAKKIFEK